MISSQVFSIAMHGRKEVKFLQFTSPACTFAVFSLAALGPIVIPELLKQIRYRRVCDKFGLKLSDLSDIDIRIVNAAGSAGAKNFIREIPGHWEHENPDGTRDMRYAENNYVPKRTEIAVVYGKRQYIFSSFRKSSIFHIRDALERDGYSFAMRAGSNRRKNYTPLFPITHHVPDLSMTADQFISMYRGDKDAIYSPVRDFTGIYIILNETKNSTYIGQSYAVMETVYKLLRGQLKRSTDLYREFDRGDSIVVRIIPFKNSGYASLNAMTNSAEAAYTQYTSTNTKIH